MTHEAKKAAKLEKKLKILLGGYQVILLHISDRLLVYTCWSAPSQFIMDRVVHILN